MNARAQTTAVLILLTLLSLGVTGYRQPFVVEAMTGLAVLASRTPGLFPGDPFAEAFGRFPSAVWSVMEWVPGALDSVMMLFLWVASRALAVYTFHHLGGSLVRLARLDEKGSPVPLVLATIAALAPAPLIGSGGFTPPAFTHSALAMPLVLLALSLAMRGAVLVGALLLAGCCALQMLAVLHAVPFFLAVIMICRARIARTVDWPLLIPGTILLVALAVAFLCFRPGNGATGAERGIAAGLLRLYNPHHTDPGVFPVGRHMWFLGLAALGLGMGIRTSLCPQLKQLLGVFSALALAAWVLAWLPIPIVAFLQPMRAPDFWYPVMLGGVLVALSGHGHRGRAGMLLVVACCSALAGTRYAGIVYTIPLIYLLVLPMADGGRLFLGALVVLLGLDSAAQSIRRVRDNPHQGRVAAILGTVSEKDLSGWGPLAESRGDAQAVARWARENMPQETTIGVPPSWTFFRLESRRTVQVLLFDVHAAYLDPATAVIWQDRMAAMGCPDAGTHRWMPAEADAAFAALSDAARRTQPVDFWVLPRSTPTGMPIVAEFPGFRVVRRAP